MTHNKNSVVKVTHAFQIRVGLDLWLNSLAMKRFEKFQNMLENIEIKKYSLFFSKKRGEDAMLTFFLSLTSWTLISVTLKLCNKVFNL